MHVFVCVDAQAPLYEYHLRKCFLMCANNGAGDQPVLPHCVISVIVTCIRFMESAIPKCTASNFSKIPASLITDLLIAYPWCMCLGKEAHIVCPNRIWVWLVSSSLISVKKEDLT